MALGKPPINTQADSIAVKGWFSNIYRELNSGILVPGGGIYSTPLFPSRRNLLVNGDFMINQRVPTPNTIIASTSATPQWTLDRWAITNPPGVQWIVQSPMTSLTFSHLGSQYAVTIAKATGNTSTALMYFAQAVESKIIQEIAGLPVTLSFWATGTPTFNSTYWANQTFNGTTGLVMANVRTGTGVDEGTLGAYTGSKFLPSCGFTPGPYWQFYSVTGTIPANARELEVYFQLQPTAVAAPGNSFLRIAQVQLEVGTQPTAFDKIGFDQSLIECQRFYEKSFDYAVTPGPVTNNYKGAIIYKAQVASTTAGWDAPIAFKVRKAKDPTMTAYCIDNAGAPTAWWNFTRIAVSGVSAFVGPGEWGFVARNPQIAADFVGNEIGLHWDASADI